MDQWCVVGVPDDSVAELPELYQRIFDRKDDALAYKSESRDSKHLAVIPYNGRM